MSFGFHLSLLSSLLWVIGTIALFPPISLERPAFSVLPCNAKIPQAKVLSVQTRLLPQSSVS